MSVMKAEMCHKENVFKIEEKIFRIAKKKKKKTKEERFSFKIEETLSNQDSFFETEKIFFLFRGEILLQLEDFLNQQIKNLRSSIRNNDYCRQCGHSLSRAHVFCGSCGGYLISVAVNPYSL